MILSEAFVVSKSSAHVGTEFLLLKQHKFTVAQKLQEADCIAAVLFVTGSMKQCVVLSLIHCYCMLQMRHGFTYMAT
jgi:hypothetical protein